MQTFQTQLAIIVAATSQNIQLICSTLHNPTPFSNDTVQLVTIWLRRLQNSSALNCTLSTLLASFDQNLTQFTSLVIPNRHVTDVSLYGQWNFHTMNTEAINEMGGTIIIRNETKCFIYTTSKYRPGVAWQGLTTALSHNAVPYYSSHIYQALSACLLFNTCGISPINSVAQNMLNQTLLKLHTISHKKLKWQDDKSPFPELWVTDHASLVADNFKHATVQDGWNHCSSSFSIQP